MLIFHDFASLIPWSIARPCACLRRLKARIDEYFFTMYKTVIPSLSISLSGSKLLIFLNILDLMVCLSGVISLASLDFEEGGLTIVEQLVQIIYKFFAESTGFATCLLSAVRCISLHSPFYKVNKIGVVTSTGLFMGYVLTRAITINLVLEEEVYERIFADDIHLSIILGDIGLMIAVTSIVNTFSMVTLFLGKDIIPAQSRASSVKATVTVAILSVLFCFFNVFYMIGNLLGFNKFEGNYGFLEYFGIFYAIPCNSAINPLIYLIRKKEMKKFILSLVRKKRERPDVHDRDAARQTSQL